MDVTKTNLPDGCANSDCPNTLGQGQFVMLESKQMVVGGQRKIRFFMCAPCAAALTRSDSNIKVGGTIQ